MKKIFVAGAGLVAKPLVKYLLNQPEFAVDLADVDVDRAIRIIEGHPRGAALGLDIQDESALKSRIAGADLLVSFVPYTYHPVLGRMAIAFGIPMVTASYISPAMKDLDADARRKGVLILNELGLDPGIDHMEAMRVIQGVKNEGGRVLGFISHCGGLPAPEAKTNPFAYKFSWSPKGVLLAGTNSARYIEDGKIVSIPAEKLFESFKLLTIPGLGEFEAYPNRDSVPYAEAYGIPEPRFMLRGTLRYSGWCSTMKKVGDLGYLDQEPRDFSGMTYAGFLKRIVSISPGESLRAALARFLNIEPASEVIDRLEWLGLLDETPIPFGKSTALDVLTGIMIEKLRYAEGERDMIILRHEFLTQRADGTPEKITSTLIDYGIPRGDSSMSRTVGLPAAIGARYILEGKIRKTGVQTPMDPEIYEPILAELKNYGIEFKQERSLP